ncbi:MAG: DUF364 domain-containing protein [Desulfobacterales bacterium]|nr:DUF364 domain-containing protein [Desulfobacterales bacterium]MDD4072006.1 DUF364 domain-containing protein [Desulfobacterales bacterium]MDD4393900.1 DUF364 domain-containing protein [Desulfobacterales bacterium]
MQQLDILNTILAELDHVPDHPVTDVVLGKHIAGVESQKLGIATWAIGKHPAAAGQLPKKKLPESAKELARFLLSDDPMEASLGLAAVNSLLPDPPADELIPRNASELILEYGQGKNVAVIGHFPFVEDMADKFSRFWVLEKDPQKGDTDAGQSPEVLPQADVVAITAVTLSNGTLGGILTHISADAVKILVGPSTPMARVLFKMGFCALAGSIVNDTPTAKLCIASGCSFRMVKGVTHVLWG